MIPFVAAGAAAGGLSYFVGLPLAYAAFLAIAIIAVAVGVTSALTVKVPQVEPKVRKTKEKVRRNSTPAPASEDSTDVPNKTDKSEEIKADSKATNKRDKERAKRAAKKEAEEKAKQAEIERAAAEEKAAAKAAAAEKKAAEEAEKERLAALEAAEEDEGEEEVHSKKKNKKKKKKTEEKKGSDAPAAKPLETKTTAAKTDNAKKDELAASTASKKNDAKKTEASSASKKSDAGSSSKKTEVSKPVEQPAAAPEHKTEEKETKTAPQDFTAWEEVKGGKKKRVAETVAPTSATSSATSSSTPEHKVETTIDPKHFGVIIGRAGSTLKQITEATQTNIDFSKKEEGKVTVTGSSRENIDRAIEAMNQLASKGSSVLTHGRRDEGSIVVPPNKRFNVIGSGGQIVKLIQDKLKVKVNLPDRSSSDSTVTVSGENNDDVQEALKCIAELIDKGYSEITHPGHVSETIEVPNGQIGSIIGAQGSTIKEIQESTGAKLNIEGSSVVVVGQRSQVTEATNKIAQLLTPPEPLPADPEWSQEASSRYVDLW